MSFILQNIVSILSLGFLGLSFLFVYLGYTNVRQIVDQENPNENAVNLSKFFMKTAMFFMVLAGPLQWITIIIQNYVDNRGVVIHVTMTHPDWQETYGNILVVEKGKMHPLVNKAFKTTRKDQEEIQLNAAPVMAAIRKYQRQLVEVTKTPPNTLDAPPTTGSEVLKAVTKGILEGG